MPDENLGDIDSDAPGTGARYNAGKPPLHLIPVRLLATWMTLERTPRVAGSVDLAMAMQLLGEFQTRRNARPDEVTLLLAMDELGANWEECAYVFQYGMTKYKEWNWVKGMSWQAVISCAARHLLAAHRKQEPDTDSGRSHVGHAMCNLVMLWTYTFVWKEGDDRPERKLFWPQRPYPEENSAPVMVPERISTPQLEDFIGKYGYEGSLK